MYLADDLGDGLLLPAVCPDLADGLGMTDSCFDVVADNHPEDSAPTELELDILVPSLLTGQVLYRLPTTSTMGVLASQLPKIGRLLRQLGDKFIA